MNDSPNILIVEDDGQWSNLFRAGIKGLGAIDTAISLEAAKECSQRKYYEVAIVDLRLHSRDLLNYDGVTYFEYLHGLGEGTSIVIVSANATIAIARDAFKNYHAHHLIEKSKLEIPELREIVTSGIEKAKKKLPSPEIVDFFRGMKSEGIFVSEFVQCLHPKGGYPGMRELLSAIGEAYWPLRPRRAAPGLRIIDSEERAEGWFWSRRIGAEISVNISRSDAVGDEPEEKTSDLKILRRAGLSAEVRVINDSLTEYIGIESK